MGTSDVSPVLEPGEACVLLVLKSTANAAQKWDR